MRTPRRYVEAPPTTPAPFGLLSVATVIEDGDDKLGFGTIYQPYACGPASADTGPCAPDYMGQLTVTVDDASTATLSAETDPDRPGSLVDVDWGDGTTEQLTLPTATDPTHTYTAGDDTYTVTVTDARPTLGWDGSVHVGSWQGTADVVVTDGAASGPYAVLGGPRAGYDDNGRAVVESHPFQVYRLATCRMVGDTEADALDRSERELHLGEARAVEAVVAEVLAIAAGADPGLLLPAPVHPVAALAQLEDFARANYGGVPVIHMPVYAATILASYHAIEKVGTQLQTKQGSLVAAGYPDSLGTLPLPWSGDHGDPLEYPNTGDNELVMYATGQVTIRRGAVEKHAASTGAQRVHNERSARAQRAYDVSVDCFTAAVTMTRDPYTVTP